MVWVSAEFLQSVVSPQSCVAGVACVFGPFSMRPFCSPMRHIGRASGGVLEGHRWQPWVASCNGAKLVVATFVLQGIFSAAKIFDPANPAGSSGLVCCWCRSADVLELVVFAAASLSPGGPRPMWRVAAVIIVFLPPDWRQARKTQLLAADRTHTCRYQFSLGSTTLLRQPNKHLFEKCLGMFM